MVVIHGSAISSGLLLADSQPVASDNPTATLWVTCRHEKICICNTRSCKSIFVIYSPLTSVNTNYRVSKFNWKCLCWFRITISPLWLCSYCNVSPTQNVVWSYTRYSSQCYIGAIAIPSTSSWTTTKQQCWTNKNVEYQWENGFIVWDYSPLWLESNGNPMSWIITAASKKRTWILVFSFQSPNFSSKCWSTCRLWHLQNRVHGIWKRYWENNRRNRSSPLFNSQVKLQ